MEDRNNNPFNMRQYNLNLLRPHSSLSPPVSKLKSTTSTVSMSFTTPAKSLDLLRQNIQRSVNQDIRNVITKYMELFFKPGIENIRSNSGPDSVTDDHIHIMCRQILEDAKRMYPVRSSTPSPSSMSCSTIGSAIDHESSDYSQSHHSQISNDQVKLPHASPTFGIKRESDDTDSEASSMSNASKKMKKSANNNNKSSGGNESSAGKNNNAVNNGTAAKPKKPSGPSRKHVANWDLDKLIPDTLFIMGAKANKALGFAQTRGRLYVKHPGLFKYASDSDDKEWLSKNKLMPATGGRAYIMLLEDIEKLAQDNKLNVTINYDDIKGFRVPDFILEKMKSYISKWKKQYAEEAQRTAVTAAAAGNRNRNHNSMTMNLGNPLIPVNSTPAPPTGNGTSTNLPSINPPPTPLPLHSPMPPSQQHQQQSHLQNSQSLNSYHLSGNSIANNVMYDHGLMPLPQQTHGMSEIREYIQMEKPPPMYPGSAQPQHAMPPQSNPTSHGGYVHSTHLDPIEQALTKGDWSGVSDRSLLQYALQSSRNIGSWDPQDSFDLIDSVTNGSISIAGNIGEISPLLQISPDAGAHLTAPPLGPASPNCELSAVLDQAFHYPDT